MAANLTIFYLLISASLSVQEYVRHSTLTENQKAYQWTQRHLDVRETHGNNRSPQIDEWNLRAGVPVGSNWCGSYVASLNDYMGWSKPNSSAWSPAWNTKATRVAVPDTGDAFTIFYTNLGRIAHVGVVTHNDKHSVLTNEGNTNVAGSRTGIGVFNRRRPKASIHSFNRWR